jgi:protein-S-isoprenylcysteine O-methyltransferase Ste14
MNYLLIYILTFGIVLIKIIWIRTEIQFSSERINLQMFKTNLVEALILILQIAAALFLPFPNTPLNPVIIICGVAMYIVGFILAFWGRLTMQQSWGVPGEHAAKQDKLVTTGPFAFSRNPIYLGFILIYFGFAAAILSWLIILRIPLVYYFYKSALREEKNLANKFGKEYLDYKKRVSLFI